MESIMSPTDLFKDSLIEEAVEIPNYFDLIEFCKSTDINICEDDELWRRKINRDFYFIRREIRNMKMPQLKAIYETHLSNYLNSLVT